MTKLYPPLAVAGILLAGCASQGSFPSLAPRVVERQYGGGPPTTGPCAVPPDGCYEAGKTATPSTHAAPVADDPALRTRIADLSAQAERGRKAFADLQGPTEASAARAGESGSDNWVVAQQNLSRLEAARAQTLDTVAAFDALAIERASIPTSAADTQAIAEATAAAKEISNAQQAVIERLHARLSPN